MYLLSLSTAVFAFLVSVPCSSSSRRLLHFLINFEQTLFTLLFGPNYIFVMRYLHCQLISLYSSALKRWYLYEHEDNGIKYYTLTPPLPPSFYTITHMYIHGGGYCVHTSTEVLAGLRLLQPRAETSRVCFADYPLCPSSSTAEALASIKKYYALVSSTSQSCVISGDSAGANLALRLLLSLDVQPLGCILISPWLDTTFDSRFPIYEQERDYMSESFVRSFRTLIERGGGEHPSMSQLLLAVKNNPTKMSRVVILAGGRERMLWESVALHLASGGLSDVFVGEGGHDFCLSRALGDGGSAEEAWRVVAEKVEGWRVEVLGGGEGKEEWEEVGEVDDDDEGLDMADEEEEEDGESDEDEGEFPEVKKWVDELGKAKGAKGSRTRSKSRPRT